MDKLFNFTRHAWGLRSYLLHSALIAINAGFTVDGGKRALFAAVSVYRAWDQGDYVTMTLSVLFMAWDICRAYSDGHHVVLHVREIRDVSRKVAAE
jgi:hypothetical protein